ncbi:LacI family DNA-binding transcriptional regulator [Parasphaerochaeta coccoides]|uniref:Transcriptional regulator, LacI family n=1 Tax=Parasphaerochaeta coccoides (strain ATCC BAA-1237 / DSM 17374 / SPN1) TaxID=760011 RepID=F4GJ80_PARC1|nr:LacI family DNA-binding transcriptional regulator [Parasphaerochaeta coccoides]AEC01720.1 transcriptional regulator, LacI family [Parasphaerochaeta coccoides DSM 17374]
MVTLKDIAQAVNRSVTTVSRALSGCSDVNAETASQIRETSKRMGYVPNVYAQRLQKQSTDTIGIVVPSTSRGHAEPFFSEFLAGIGEKATEYGYDLLVTYISEENQVATYRKLVEGRRVDGFIIYRTLRDDPRVNYLHGIGMPFATFGQVENISDYIYIDEDGEYAMGLIACHLAAKGHRRIACICPPSSVMYSHIRLRGLVKGLEEQGIKLAPDLVREGFFDQKDGYEQTMALLDLDNPPTAIVGFNDMIAFGIINAAKNRKLKIGRDLAVTGFDDNTMAPFYRPPLTTIRQPTYEIGGMLVQFLIDHIRANDPKARKPQVLLRPELIVREST